MRRGTSGLLCDLRRPPFTLRDAGRGGEGNETSAISTTNNLSRRAGARRRRALEERLAILAARDVQPSSRQLGRGSVRAEGETFGAGSSVCGEAAGGATFARSARRQAGGDRRRSSRITAQPHTFPKPGRRVWPSPQETDYRLLVLRRVFPTQSSQPSRRRGRRRVLEDSEDEEAALGSGRPGSSAPLPSRPASSPGYEFLFEREEAASTTVDAEVQACVDVAERGVQASVRTRNRAIQSERLGVDVSTQTVDEEGEGEVSLGTGPRRSRRGRIDVEVQAGLPSMQRRAKWTQCRIVQRSLGCQAGPSSFRRRSRGVQTSETPRVSVGTQCEGQGRWEYDLRGRRVTTRPSAGSHLPSGLPWSEVSGWEQVVGSFVEGTESEVIESFAYVGRTWRSDSYGFNWIASFRFRP